MMLAPQYDGPAVMSIDGSPTDQAEPFIRQRRRMMAMLASMTDEQWQAESRCAGWTARDVVAHLVDVNAFWHGSIIAGVAGTPTRFLAGFDPAATPPTLVERMSSLTSDEVLDRFVTTSGQLVDVITELSEATWSRPAESPAGHVPIRLLVQHALWDCWVHERDIALPLGISPATEPDELRSCLQYAAAISPVLGMAAGAGMGPPIVCAVEATNPAITFVVEVDKTVSVRNEPVAGLPCLRGDALDLVEALSLRSPMPSSAPVEWMQLLTGLTVAFDAV